MISLFIDNNYYKYLLNLNYILFPLLPKKLYQLIYFCAVLFCFDFFFLFVNKNIRLSFWLFIDNNFEELQLQMNSYVIFEWKNPYEWSPAY